ncbi:hypothetical protein [Nocardia sp. NPDC051832]|uniref:hypothetical protein n=1 Tax=Nocardia sp. NPDC051832 TaxID=3155673 RepID=UPI00343C7070
MSTERSEYVLPQPRQRWTKSRRGVALLVVGLYLAVMIRLLVSQNWNDLVVSRLAGVTLLVAVGLIVLSMFDSPRQRRTTRKTAAVPVAIALINCCAGVAIIWTEGHPVSHAVGFTGLVALMLFLSIG